MAITKTTAAITQLTAAGTSTTLACATSAGQTLALTHSNGTGTPTVAATASVQWKASSGARWNALTVITFTLTAASVEQQAVRIPDEAAQVQVVYTAPTGPTGFTLDAELALITP